MLVSRVWLITGASRGIGRALVQRVLDSGDRVAMLARGDAVERLAVELGPNCVGLKVDVGDADGVSAAIDRVMETWGQLDVVVNNAGLHRGGRLARLDEADWNEVLSTNLNGAMNVMRFADPHLQAGASVINVGAVVGFRGFPGDAAYAASKAGLAGLTRALAIEYAQRAVCVNLVIPGLVLTDMTEALSDRALESMQTIIPLGRYGEADEVAAVIEWVSQSRYMTGAFVPVDGGLLSSFGAAL